MRSILSARARQRRTPLRTTLRSVACIALVALPMAASAVSVLSYDVIGKPAFDPQIHAPVTIGPDGLPYTVAMRGGYGLGSILRVENDGTLTVVHALDAYGSEGASPEVGLTLGADGWLYGATEPAFGLPGNVYKVSTAGEFMVLHQFDAHANKGLDAPSVPLVQAVDGTFYGAAAQGGSGGQGGIFSMAPDGQQFKVLHAFAGDSDGAQPSSLTLSRDGTLFGATRFAGDVCGTVFKLRPGHKLVTMHVFDGSTEGCMPWGALVRGPDRALYGATYYGGSNWSGEGTVFRVGIDDGAFSVVHAFTQDDRLGENPIGGLTRDAEGNLYGTANAGGPKSGGTVFVMNRQGSAKLLHAFELDSKTDGFSPYAAPTVLPDGTLYGTTSTSSDFFIFATIWKMQIAR